MPEKSTTTPYVPGGSAVAQAANEEYKKALEDMLTTLDTRKSRLFDPQLLALSKGFLAPNPSGSFFSALGNAADEAGKAQLEQEKEAREIAQAKLGLAGQKVGLARQQEGDTILNEWLQGQKAGRTGFQSPGAPGAPRAPGAVGAAPRGYQIAPGNPGLMDPMEYIAMSRRFNADPSKIPDLLKNADQMTRDRYKTTEKGTHDLGSGMFYPAPGTGMVEVTLAGVPGKTFKVPENVAVQLSMLYQDALSGGDPAPYQQLSNRISKGFGSGIAPSAPAAPSAPSAPTASSAAPAKPAPSAVTTFGGMPSTQDIQTSQKASEALATKRAETIAKSEAEWPDIEKNAIEMNGIANRVTGLTKESGQVIGMLDRPGVANAIGLLLSKKFFNQDGTVDQNAFTTALRNSGLIKNLTEQDIANINMIGADLARLELMYAKEYLSGSGSVTENERLIARRLGGSLGENPKSLLQKMKLVRLGSQHKIDVGQAWNDYMTNTPDGDWSKFSRTIKRQMDIDFQKQLAREFRISPSIPTKAKKAGLEKSKEIVNGLLGR